MIQNFLRGPFTTIMGILVVAGTVYVVEVIGQMQWIWGGLVGIGIGLFLWFVADPKFIADTLARIRDKFLPPAK